MTLAAEPVALVLAREAGDVLRALLAEESGTTEIVDKLLDDLLDL